MNSAAAERALHDAPHGMRRQREQGSGQDDADNSGMQNDGTVSSEGRSCETRAGNDCYHCVATAEP